MKHISILLPAGSTVVDTVIAPYGLLRMANAYMKQSGKLDHDLFSIDIVGLSREPVTYNDLFRISPTKSIDEIEKTDLALSKNNVFSFFPLCCRHTKRFWFESKKSGSGNQDDHGIAYP